MSSLEINNQIIKREISVAIGKFVNTHQMYVNDLGAIY